MARTHTCNARLERGDVPISALGLDPLDFSFLTAARYFCLSFAEPSEHSWVTVMLSSTSFFPDPGSAEAMRRVLAVVHEMRSSRRSAFRFSNPRCEGCSAIVTDDERHLVQLIQATRAQRPSLAAPSAILLCEGHDSERLRKAAVDFASAFPIREPVTT